MQLQDVQTQEELKELLDSEVFDFLLDIGVTQPTTSIRLIDVPDIIEMFVSHHTVVSVKAQLDPIVDGFRDSLILNLFRHNPSKMGELLMHTEKNITADNVIALFEPILSPEGIHVQCCHVKSLPLQHYP